MIELTCRSQRWVGCLLFRGEVSPIKVHSQQGKGGDGAYTMFGQQVPAFPRDGRSETV